MMRLSKPVVSIVIVNWNTSALLRHCLRSIIQETSQPYEIIVVDNGSTDATQEMIRNEYPQVALIANEKNVGFAAANNQGIGIAAGQYVLMLNPDTIIRDRAIDKMIYWCGKHPDVGCAGCQVYETEERLQKTCFQDYGPLNLLLIETGLQTAFPTSKWFGRAGYGYWDRCTEKDVDVVSGMFMLIPRRVLDEVGLMDEAFFVYGEEADICRRIRQTGLRCVFTPIASILHKDGGGKSTSQMKPRMYVQLQKSKVLYISKYYGLYGVLLARSTIIVSQFLRFALFGPLSLVLRNGEMGARARLARAALIFHISGIEPIS